MMSTTHQDYQDSSSSNGASAQTPLTSGSPPSSSVLIPDALADNGASAAATFDGSSNGNGNAARTAAFARGQASRETHAALPTLHDPSFLMGIKAEQDAEASASTQSVPAPPSTASSSKHGAGSSSTAKDSGKKKRRQMVACDSCRLRRVRCNKADLPAGVDCSECAKKNIKCTDTYIKSKPKLSRTGKLIEQAKVLYGDGELPSPLPSPTETEASMKSYMGAPPSQQQALTSSADARLAGSESARAFADHLIQVYFHMFHRNQSPVVQWDVFEREFNTASRNVRLLSPPLRCLTSVMMAWGAVFSDHPAILGVQAPTLAAVRQQHLPSDRARSAPDYAAYGNARARFVHEMQTRALAAVDEIGAFRRPNGHLSVALLLLEYHLSFGRLSARRGRHMLNAVCEHMRCFIDPDGDDSVEENANARQRLLTGVVFYVVYTRDALSSAIAGRQPALSKEDIQSISPAAASFNPQTILQVLRSRDAATLVSSGVICIFAHISELLRTIALHLTSAASFSTRLHDGLVATLWTELESSASYRTMFLNQLESVNFKHEHQLRMWARDHAGMQRQAALAMHVGLTRRIEQEQATRTANAAAGTMYADDAYLDQLQRWKSDWDYTYLEAIRDGLKASRALEHDLLGTCSISLEYFQHSFEHILQVPGWEEGGRNPKYLIKDKFETLSFALAITKKLSWSFSDYGDLIQRGVSILDTLEARMQEQRAATVDMMAGAHSLGISDTAPQAFFDPTQPSAMPTDMWDSLYPQGTAAYAAPPPPPMPSSSGYPQASFQMPAQPSYPPPPQQ